MQLKISRVARAAICNRLSDPSTGFTPRLTASLADAGITAPPGCVLPINFSSGSKNFFQANVLPEMIADSSTYTLPYMTLFAMRAENTNLEKFAEFAGPIQMGLNFFLSWKSNAVLYDMETLCDCYEEAFFGAFNDPAIAAWSQQFDSRLVYNGGIALARGALDIDKEENWLQGFYGVIGMDVHQIN